MFLGPGKMAWFAMNLYANDEINARNKEVRVVLACTLPVIGRLLLIRPALVAYICVSASCDIGELAMMQGHVHLYRALTDRPKAKHEHTRRLISKLLRQEFSVW